MKRHGDSIQVDEVCNIKKEIKVNYNLCIICQRVNNKEATIKEPSEISLEKVFLKLKERDWENEQYASIVELLEKENVRNLQDKKCTYHRSCYGRVTNVNTQRRSLERKQNKENVSTLTENIDVGHNSKCTRSSSTPYNRLLCFFCQEDSDCPLFNLRSFNRHKLMKEAIDKSKKEILTIRFNSFSDAHAGDVKYHANCMITNVDKVLSPDTEKSKESSGNDAKRYAVEEELVRSVANGIQSGSIYSMKDIYTSYRDALKDNNVLELRTEKTIKKRLKNILVTEIDDITFEKSVQCNQSEKVYSSSYSSNLLDAAICKTLSDVGGNMKQISESATIIRAASLKAIRDAEKHFDTSEHIHETDIPAELYSFIRWTLGGFKDLHGKRNKEVDNVAKNICNTILYNVKTDRQVTYKSVNEEIAKFRHAYENAQAIGLGLTTRQYGRKKGLVDLLHNVGFSISNERCLAIETSIANEVIKSIAEKGFYLPPNAKQSRIIQFHLDNCNILEDCDDGKNITNSLLLVGSQYCDDNNQTPYTIPRSNNKTLLPNNFHNLSECATPLNKDFKHSPTWKDFEYFQNGGEFIKTYQSCMKPWLVVKSLETGISKLFQNNSSRSICVKEEDDLCIEIICQNSATESEEADPEIDFTIANSDQLSMCDTLPISEKSTQWSLCDSICHDTKRCFNSDTLNAISSAATDIENLQLPSYSAYNSILLYGCGNYQKVANTLTFPLIPGPANDYNAIYTGLMLAQHVNTDLCGGKTIITLDLDLYERAIKLRNSRADLLNSFILRLGELHIVFAEVRAIGSFCENTGIDDAWLKSDLIGPCTVRQVLTCSHMKRALIIHEATLLALYERYICSVVKEYPQIFVNGMDSILQVTVQLNTCIGSGNLDSVADLNEKVKNHLIKVEDLLQNFEKDHENNNQYKMLRTYMKMVERLFIFIHATRSRNWKLHLSSTEELMRDICSMNRIKYRRMLPVYLAEMYALEKTDIKVWEAFCDGEFSVQVRSIPFVAIGMDHKGEQINKQVKADGGIIGISQNKNARDRFMLTAPILGEISHSFKTANGVNDAKQKHHQLTKAYTKRQNQMKEKLATVFESYNVDFDRKDDQDLRNFVTNQIFPDNTKRDILRVEKIGEDAYKLTVDERLSQENDDENNVQKKHLLEPIKRLTLNLPNKLGKKKVVKVDQQLLEVKSHRDFFGRCALVAASNREFDMKDIIGNFELDAVPRSLMTSTGVLHDGHTNKHQLVENLTDKYTVHVAEPTQDVRLTPEFIGRKIIVVDAMVVVQSVANKKGQKRFNTCKEFADTFMNKLKHLLTNYDEVRIVFDNYQDRSVKNSTRERRGKQSHAQRFVIEDQTQIKMSMKEFLSDVATKGDITIYLAEKCKLLLEGMGVSYLISVNSETFGNIVAPRGHNHEEADTLILWHCMHATIPRSNSHETVIVVFSSDTDVACGLVHFKDQIHAHLYMKTQFRYLNISSIADSLSTRKKALISIHSLSGCDTTGCFGSGRSKKGKNKWMEAFKDCGNETLTALESLQFENPLEHIETLEKLLCKLYCPGVTQVNTLSEARWHMYTKNVAQCENLPPTSGAFKQALLRAAYQAQVWALSDKSYRQLPDPEKYGWEITGDSFSPITSEAKIAPDAILNLIMCGCAKSDCCSGHCKCFKNKLTCTALCQCADNCENNDNLRFVLDNDLDDDDLFDQLRE